MPIRSQSSGASRGCWSPAVTRRTVWTYAATRITERGATRADDKFSEAAMEDRKREGYF